jgi:hypothetical protein
MPTASALDSFVIATCDRTGNSKEICCALRRMLSRITLTGQSENVRGIEVARREVEGRTGKNGLWKSS